MLKSFSDRRTAAVFRGLTPKGIGADVARAARKKLVQLDAASALDSLRVPPGNRLEALKGERAGQYSIRVNDQFRICFVWRGGDAFEVELVDYH